MKHTFFIYTFLSFIFLLLGTKASIGDERLTSLPGLKVKTVYLDPWYGGREKGPLFPQKQYGKDITLKIAQKLQGLLEADGFTVYLSRNDDRFVPLVERSFQAKSRGADIHLTIKVSKRKENCIRTVILQTAHQEKSPKPNDVEGKKLNELKDELGRILKDLEVSSRQRESSALAAMISKKLKDGQMAGCVWMLEGYDYILANAAMPAVFIDFGISSTFSREPSILDEAAQDKIVRSIAESIKEYSDERVKPIAQ